MREGPGASILLGLRRCARGVTKGYPLVVSGRHSPPTQDGSWALLQQQQRMPKTNGNICGIGCHNPCTCASLSFLQVWNTGREWVHGGCGAFGERAHWVEKLAPIQAGEAAATW